MPFRVPDTNVYSIRMSAKTLSDQDTSLQQMTKLDRVVYSPLTLNTFPSFTNSASNDVLICPREHSGCSAANSSMTPTLLSFGIERTSSFNSCCMSGGSGCCDF